MNQGLYKKIQLHRAIFRQDGSPVLEIKPYTIIELCYMYDTSRNTFKKWLMLFVPGLGKRCGNYYTILQVEMIFERLGKPLRKEEA